MAINKDSNGYVIGFSVVMVVVVGALLAYIATALKPMQDANVFNEKKQNILQSIGLRDMERSSAEAEFKNYVKERVLLNYDGEIAEGAKVYTSEEEVDPTDKKDPFNLDMLKQYKANKEDYTSRVFPLYICEKDGEKLVVAPVQGQGLWAGVWGYISLNTEGVIQGAVFDHKSETPGLGAEITKDFFEEQFIGKSIRKSNGEFGSVRVVKPGQELYDSQVDGISGGTFTSVGVDEMIQGTLVVYDKYLKNNK